MNAVQLDLFSGAIITSPAISCSGEQGISLTHEVIDPCVKCEYKGLCPDDECGQLNFPIDVPSPDFMTEEEYMWALRRNDLVSIVRR